MANATREAQTSPLHKLHDDRLSANAWQERLLPVMTKMLIGLTFFFLAASLVQLVIIEWHIQNIPKFDPNTAVKAIDTSIPLGLSGAEMPAAQLKAAVLLEAHVLERRYHQGMILLMSRTWISYLGFITGMILCMVGAVFILGKLQEPEAGLTAKSQPVEFTLRTASPGVLMAAFGTFLITLTIVTHHEIAVTDHAVYVTPAKEADDDPDIRNAQEPPPLDDPRED